MIALYPTADNAWARILERDWAVERDESYARELLAQSVGVDAVLIPHFRPWYVGAKMLEQNQDSQRITEAEGVKFTRLQPVIDSLLQLQRQYDEANALTIPPGFEAIPSDCDRCDSSNGGTGVAGVARKPRRIQTVRR